MSPTNKRIVQPYLSFEGHCDEALEFYRKAIGAEVTTLLRYKDSPDPGMRSPGSDDKVLHAALRIGETTVFASDGHCKGQSNFQGISLALTAPPFESRRVYKASCPRSTSRRADEDAYAARCADSARSMPGQRAICSAGAPRTASAISR